MSIYKNGIWTQNSFKERLLPEGYTQVEYIANSNTQHIDTGIIPTSNTKIDIDFMYLNHTINNWNPIFGERNATTATYFAMFIQPTTLILSPNYAGYDPGTSSQISIEANVRYNFRNENGQWYINDELKPQMSTTNTLITGTKSIYLFALHQNDETARYGTQIRIYQCKIYEGQTLVRYFIPCYRNSDNVIGMYDIVNRIFYENVGTGTFNKGNNIGGTSANVKIYKDDNLLEANSFIEI